MGIFRSYIPVDMINWPGEDGDDTDLVYSDATTIVFSDGSFSQVFTGSFYNVTEEDAYGRLDTITFDAGGQLLFSMSQINRDMHAVAQAQSSAGLYSYLLSGDDRMFVPASDDNVRGFAGNDYIRGGGGNDILLGEKGLDRLYGGNGADHLDGGTGGDLMSGGMGNDRYYSDNANDRIVEAANQGTETIYASASRGMATNVENLTLTGNQATWAVGNGLANVIRANGLGNSLAGGAGDDWIYGGNGNDRISCGPGNDHMTGGGGFDLFVFADPTGQDVVHAFQRGVDRINLAAIDANAAALGNQAFVYIGSTSFSGTAAGELRYDGATLSGDVNGDGQTDFEIEIANHVPLAFTDLVL